MNKFSALTGIPEFTKGFVRELRVRWALKELNLPYEADVYQHPRIKEGPYLKHQPFGQVPYFQDENVEMFESGAILLHLALKHGQLLSQDEKVRAETLSWFFAALNTVEPYISHHIMLKMSGGSEELIQTARKALREHAEVLSVHMWDRTYFAGKEFSIADILMTSVCRELAGQGLLQELPTLMAYKERMEDRVAFKEALDEHHKLY